MGTSETREIERKYAVAADAGLPAIRGVPQVAETRRRAAVRLDAQYFDTDDLVLLAHRVTLRRRTGGTDAGWHLKLPGDGFRREIHHRLTEDDAVPEALLRYLHVRLRGRPVAPVVRLATSRTVVDLLDADGTRLAEICDDEVVSTPQLDGVGPHRWREWEVELHAGDPSLLDAVEPLLLDAGATTDAGPSKLARALEPRTPPAAPDVSWPPHPSVVDVARRYLAAETARLQEHDPGARIDAPDAVHQMRVAARRLRSVLSSYRDLIGRDRAAWLRSELRALADALGDARDSEVMLARLRRLLDAQPADRVRGPVRERITATLQRRHREALATATQFMTSGRYYALLDALDALVREATPADDDRAGDHDAGPASDDLVRVFDRDWKRLRTAVRRAAAVDDGPTRERALHEVRKAAKRLRYGMDSVSGVLGKRARRTARAATAITEILGEHNDRVITAALIGELGGEAFAAGEDSFTYGRMQALEDAGALLSRDDYRAALKRLDKARFRRWKAL